MSIVSAANTTGKKLCLNDLHRAIKVIEDQPPHPCRLGKHVLNAKALREPGRYPCGNCGQVINISVPLGQARSES